MLPFVPKSSRSRFSTSWRAHRRVQVQKHTIKNTMFLKVALIEHTFVQLLPQPKPETSPDLSRCIWRSKMLYAEQLDMMILLQV